MQLEKFNHNGKFIEFNPAENLWNEIAQPNGDMAIQGVGDMLDGSHVALVGKSGGLTLYVNKMEFHLDDPSLKMQYEHKKEGTTTFLVIDRTKNVQIEYKSWWLSSPPGVVALADTNDEDEDLCAYIIFMTKVATRKAHLINRYS